MEAGASLIDAAAADLDDYFEFQIERSAGAPDVGAGGVRYRATALVAGRLFEELIIDVGFVGNPVIDPERLETSGALSFAGIDPVQVPAARLEQHLAEKLHAYSRTNAGGQPSSRPKDLIDILLIAELARFDAKRVRAVIDTIFSARATHPRPDRL